MSKRERRWVMETHETMKDFTKSPPFVKHLKTRRELSRRRGATNQLSHLAEKPG
jgi:hypothetical protein